MDNLVNVNMEIGPSEKLSEVISSALGAWIAPWAMKRVAKAEAEADRIKAIEGAKTEALLANNDERYAELSAMEKRIVAKESKRQNNINNVVAFAAQSLKDDKDVSSEPVNPDWATRFFDITQDISDKDMQNLWGRILAGEIKQPSSYSLRTLDALRNITREEAQLFEKIAKYVLYDGTYFIYRDLEPLDGESRTIRYEDVAKLVEIGFIHSGSMVVRQYFNKSTELVIHHLIYMNKIAFIEHPEQSPMVTIPIYSLTEVGRELYNLITTESDYTYFDRVLREIKQKSKNIHIKSAQLTWIDYRQGQFEYDEKSINEIL